MRRALGLTPLNRVENLENNFRAVAEAARATEVAYHEVIDRLRQNDIAIQNSLLVSSETSLHSDELHHAAAVVLQPDAKSKGGASEIDTANILSQRLRPRE